ncbi:Probable phosphoribosylformylglycinamidine synthase II PurL [Mycobacteroides abscessus subsp. abscessus]|nr:Probable phosphoribosylformylglycinamidine synthase II PurL [Mycobacteroides abscessus subsp. abscessus]
MGVSLTLDLDDVDPTLALFSESAARALVTLPGGSLADFEALCAEHGVPLQRIGEVTGDDQIEIQSMFSLPLARVREVWSGVLPNVLG